MSLEGKTAIVTGASSGIGRRTAVTFAENGADVAIADVREEPKGDEEVPTAELVREAGQKALFHQVDVADHAECEALVESVVDEFGGVDVLVNNAGNFLESARGKTVEDLTEEEWSRMVQVNLTGVFNCTKFALPHLRESDAARIVNVASKMGLVGHPTSAAYGAAKGGTVLLTKQLAIDYAPDEITVNAVCPGIIRTGTKTHRFDQKGGRMRENTPLPYLGEPEDIANAVRFLSSEEAKFVTGHVLVVDGGWTAQ